MAGPCSGSGGIAPHGCAAAGVTTPALCLRGSVQPRLCTGRRHSQSTLAPVRKLRGEARTTMSCSWVMIVFMELITCLLSHCSRQSQRGAGCWGWWWGRDAPSWPHGSGTGVVPWPGLSGHRHQPGVLQRVLSSPSGLGCPVLAKTLHAERTWHIAATPGSALLRAHLACFQ